VSTAGCIFGNIIRAARAHRRLAITQPVQVVTAYKFFHPTVSGALVISGKEAVVE
jgi:hypothetical protein